MLINMLNFLAKPKILWFTFAAVVVLSVGFALVTRHWNFGIIDEMYVAEEIRHHIAAMSAKQRLVHAWMTATLDVAYPFAYGGFFIGVAMRYFGRFGLFLALPSMAVIPIDLLEGLSQIMLLNGQKGFMALKLWMTPIKLILFLAGFLITMVGLLRGAISNFKRRRHVSDTNK